MNNDKVSSPHTFTKGGSVYIPVWYVIQALNNAGIHSTWKGKQLVSDSFWCRFVREWGSHDRKW